MYVNTAADAAVSVSSDFRFASIISIISPISRRLLHPLQSSDPKVIKTQARRRALGAQKG